VVEAYTRTQLRYLKLSVLLTDGDEFEAQLGDSAEPVQETGPQARQREAVQMWWRVSAVALRRKMMKKQLVRTLLEVSMFSYMGVTKKAMSALLCTEVDGEQHSYSAMDTSVLCYSGQNIVAQVIGWLVLIFFTFGFPVIIIWRLQFLQGRAEGSGEAVSKRKSKRVYGWKPGRFTTMVRVAYFFDERHRGWISPGRVCH
jgi:hypothetical protein